jgi:hypothetical protein
VLLDFDLRGRVGRGPDAEAENGVTEVGGFEASPEFIAQILGEPFDVVG